jgi:universal stress protein E
MPLRKLERILVAVANPSSGVTNAIRRASALARGTGASIELFNAIPASVSAGNLHAATERFTRLEAEQNTRRLEQTANRLRREELIVTTKVQTGYAVHEALLREVRTAGADLLVIETHKHNIFARLLLTQTDFELIRHCPVPLLIVKRRAAWHRPHVLAALDPFHAQDKPLGLDREIARAAHSVAAAVRGSVYAAHVYPPPRGVATDMSVGVAGSALEQEDRKYRAAVRRHFYGAVARCGIARNKARLVCGDPAADLPVVARSMRAALIVMGAVSRSGLKRIFIGSTAERALDSFTCDVLVVKPRQPASLSSSPR